VPHKRRLENFPITGGQVISSLHNHSLQQQCQGTGTKTTFQFIIFDDTETKKNCVSATKINWRKSVPFLTSFLTFVLKTIHQAVL
jgi:hypothetical protein